MAHCIKIDTQTTYTINVTETELSFMYLQAKELANNSINGITRTTAHKLCEDLRKILDLSNTTESGRD